MIYKLKAELDVKGFLKRDLKHKTLLVCACACACVCVCVCGPPTPQRKA